MTYATATMNLCVANDNLSAAINHYKTHNDLCLTDIDTYRAYDSLSIAANPNTNSLKTCFGTHIDLSPTDAYSL